MPNEEFSRLKTIRAAYKGHCTRDVKKAERFLNAIDKIDEAELVAIADRLNRRMEEIIVMDNQIQTLITDSNELEKEIEDALLFQDEISVWRHRIIKFTDANKTQVKQFQNDSKLSHTPKFNIKLPTINIKSFNGDPLQWLTFWDSFNATIHMNNELSAIEKMTYLTGMLQGEAARTIAGLPLTTDNYARAIELLKERFGNSQTYPN